MFKNTTKQNVGKECIDELNLRLRWRRKSILMRICC